MLLSTILFSSKSHLEKIFKSLKKSGIWDLENRQDKSCKPFTNIYLIIHKKEEESSEKEAWISYKIFADKQIKILKILQLFLKLNLKFNFFPRIKGETMHAINYNNNKAHFCVCGQGHTQY